MKINIDLLEIEWMGIVVRGIDKHLKRWNSYRAYFELDGRMFPEEEEVPVSFELSLHIWKMRHQIKRYSNEATKTIAKGIPTMF